MTDHTYAGYTAVQIRAAAEAATPGTWSVPEGADDIIAWVDIPIGGALNCGSIHCDHSLANARHVATAQPATVLALLDRIAELEKQQLKMADDVTVIQRIHGEQKAALYGRIAELEQRATRAQPAE